MSADLMPFRWPEEWKSASLLELIRGTPINCLAAADSLPFANPGLPFFLLRDDSPPPGVALRDGLWPQVQVTERGSNTAEAGPTGAPWVDANGWLIRLARTLEPERTVWLTHQPPREGLPPRPEAYSLAVAEAAAYGGRWVVALDAALRNGLASGNGEALAAWKKLLAALDFSTGLARWKDWEPQASLAVISDFSGANEFLSHEFLNLAPRHELAYRIIEKSRAAQAPLAGLHAVVYIDAGPPEGALRRRLLDFAASGGLLICPAGLPVSSPARTAHGHNIHAHGKGRVAMPQAEWEDPYLLAGEAHLLAGRGHDLIRLWNAGTMDYSYCASPDGKRAVVHLLNYSRRPAAHQVTLGLARAYRSARFYAMQASRPLEISKARLGVEVSLPEFSVHAAIELEV